MAGKTEVVKVILLDTCALLWLAADQSKLSAKAIKTIKVNPDGLFVSSISAFEIAIKTKKGKLELPMPADIWFQKAVKFHNIREIPINGSIAVRAAMLPPLHNDPCDRFIISIALLNSMSIITSDSNIIHYKEVKVIW